MSTTAKTFVADIYRLGWYGGKGGRLVLSVGSLTGHHRAIPSPASTTGMIACQWPVSFSETPKASWVTGLYVVKLTASTGLQAYIPFVVRETDPHALVFVHAANTDEAYNAWGGKSLYEDVHYFPPQSGEQRAVKVSFNRPFLDDAGAGQLFWWEYPAVRWLEKQGYNLEYVSDVDIDQHPSLLVGHPGSLFFGHDEYWSRQMRDNIDAAVAKGVNLALFAGNTGYNQIRYESYGGQPDRVVVCYRVAKLDPEYGKDNSNVSIEFRLPTREPAGE